MLSSPIESSGRRFSSMSDEGWEAGAQFGSGLVEHKAVQLRGALPPMDAPTVYVTGFTPFEHRITLT